MKKVLIDATSVRLDAKGVGLYTLQLCMRMPLMLGGGWQAIAYTGVEGASVLQAQFEGQVLVVPQCNDLYRGLVATPRLIERMQPDVLLRPSEGTGYDYGLPMVTVWRASLALSSCSRLHEGPAWNSRHQEERSYHNQFGVPETSDIV